MHLFEQNALAKIEVEVLPVRVRIGFACLLCSLTLAGCMDKPEATFRVNERTLALAPEARDAVQTALLEDFGTPHEIVAWLRFPVKFGGFQGEVVKGTGEGNPSTIKVSFQDDDVTLTEESELYWMDGVYAGASVTATAYDPESSELTTLEEFEVSPKVGDHFILDPGHVIKNGRAYYMRHCMHCHGVTGDGNGPTAQYLNPPPRDFRTGVFKFTTTLQGEKASKEDLTRIIKNGIPGTYMPSFMLLKDEEIDAITEYVRWLSMRGETEKKMVDELEGDFSKQVIAERKEGGESADDINAELETFLEEDFPGSRDEAASTVAAAWAHAEAESSQVVPKVPRVSDTAESRARGRELYLSDRTKCVTCHGPAGRGNGSATEDYWKIPGTNDTYTERGLHDDWGNPLQPRDLSKPVYRGGRRPYDLYCRIFAGIKGTPMPAFGGTVLSDEEIWDLVNYVMSMPFADAPADKKAADQMAAQ